MAIRKLKRTSAAKRNRERNRTHESVGEIMDDVLRRGTAGTNAHVVIERRIKVARMINGPSDNIDDITPKEMMLAGMRHHARAIRDFTEMLEELSKQPVTEETIAQTQALDAEIERQYAVAREFARDCAGYLHPKLQAMAVTTDSGANQMTILRELFDEIDELERTKPIPIEHHTKKLGG